MDLGELFFLKILSDIFRKDEPARRPASVHVPPHHNGHNGHAHALPHPAAPVQPVEPVHPAAPVQPAQPAPTPAFPTNVVVPPPAPHPAAAPVGFKKGVEVWQVKPELVAQGMLAGITSGQVGQITLAQLESTFPVGWTPCKVVTSTEAVTAKSLLAQWQEGRVIFMGPGNMRDRRAYVMRKHDASAPAPAPQPVPHPAAPAPTPQPTQPVVFPVTPPPPPPPAPVPPPGFDPISLPPDVVRPSPAPAPSPPSAQVTHVRHGEGLAQVAKRLGFPESADSAKALRSANVPQGPDAQWQSVDLSQGGLKKVGRKGGLQPGDALFVPAAWGPIDPALL
jgi:hypothetical protein